MVKRLLIGLLAALLAFPALAQIPGGAQIQIDRTPITGGTTGRCLYDNAGKVGEQVCGGAASSVTVGTTTITSGTTGRVLYDNAGVLGEMTTTGSGTTVALSAGPTLTGPVIASSAYASLPAAAGVTGQIYSVSDLDGALYRSNGTRWKPVNNEALIGTLDTESATVANVDTVKFSKLMPVNLVQTGDRLRIIYTFNKSGTTDTGNVIFRVGTAGTTADTAVASYTGVLNASNRSNGMILDFRLDSATALRKLVNSGNGASGGYSNAASGVTAAAVAITSAAANALYFSITISSSSTNDTVTLVDAQLYHISSAN